jgi:hypothetical protein
MRASGRISARFGSVARVGLMFFGRLGGWVAPRASASSIDRAPEQVDPADDARSRSGLHSGPRRRAAFWPARSSRAPADRRRAGWAPPDSRATGERVTP